MQILIRSVRVLQLKVVILGYTGWVNECSCVSAFSLLRSSVLRLQFEFIIPNHKKLENLDLNETAKDLLAYV